MYSIDIVTYFYGDGYNKCGVGVLIPHRPNEYNPYKNIIVTGMDNDGYTFIDADSPHVVYNRKHTIYTNTQKNATISALLGSFISVDVHTWASHGIIIDTAPPIQECYPQVQFIEIRFADDGEPAISIYKSNACPEFTKITYDDELIAGLQSVS